MASFQSTFDNTNTNESKHYNMKQFISAVGQYLHSRTDNISSLINRHLQLLSVTIDYSLFDPNTSIVCEFFVSLHELLSALDPHSSTAWYCVNVLTTACRNAAAREALIHTYQFIPPLSRLLGDHLTSDKTIRILTAMQELSCGIKISWLLPHLTHLMTTLTRWIDNEKGNEQVIALSLGVLVNLCYNNLPAIYTLSRCVDIKKFIRVCSRLEGSKMEVSVCKLLIILDYVHGVVPDDAFLKLINITFSSIIDAFVNKDIILLRHVVEFYMDVKKQSQKTDCSHEIIATYKNYNTKVKELLDVVENNAVDAKGDASSNDPECMVIIFRFLHELIELQISNLIPLYGRFVQIAMNWIHTEVVATEALSILRTVAVSTHLTDNSILEPILKGVPIFLLSFGQNDDDFVMSIEHSRRLSSIMQLLRALVQTDSTRDRTIALINEQKICKVFLPFFGNELSPRNRAADANSCTPDAINLYINTLVLINDLARFNPDWATQLTFLLQHKQMHMILAEALTNGCKKTITLILNMASNAHFPCEQIATCMSELQLFKSNAVNTTNTVLSCYPMMSSNQSEKLDETMNIIKEACSQNNLINVSTSDVMELYEYKLSSMGHAERAAVASVEAASQRCTHLQHQSAQLSAEISRIRQLFIHTTQCNEELSKSLKELNKNNRDIQTRLDAEKGRGKVTQSLLLNKERMLQESEACLEDLTKKLKEKEIERDQLDEAGVKMKQMVNKLEDNLIRQEKNSEKRDETIKKLNSNVEHYKLQVIQLDKQLEQSALEINKLNNEISTINKELIEKTDLIKAITRLTSNK